MVSARCWLQNQCVRGLGMRFFKLRHLLLDFKSTNWKQKWKQKFRNSDPGFLHFSRRF